MHCRLRRIGADCRWRVRKVRWWSTSRAWRHRDEVRDGAIVTIPATESGEACAGAACRRTAAVIHVIVKLCDRSARQFELASEFNYPYLLSRMQAFERLRSPRTAPLPGGACVFDFDGHQSYAFFFFKGATSQLVVGLVVRDSLYAQNILTVAYSRTQVVTAKGTMMTVNSR